MSTDKPQADIFSYDEFVVSVDLSTDVCNQLQQAAAALKKTTNPLHMQVFWVPPNLAHISLLYTVRVREDLQAGVVDALRMAVEEVEPFKVRIRGLALHEETDGEGGQRVKALWARVVEGEGLADLRTGMRASLADLNVQLDELDYTPHVPIALVDQFRNTREFNSAFVEWQDQDFGEVPVRAVLVKKANPREGTVSQPFSVVANLSFKQDRGEE